MLDIFLSKRYFAAYACFCSVSQLGLGLKLAHDVNENSEIQRMKAKILRLYIVMSDKHFTGVCVKRETWEFAFRLYFVCRSRYLSVTALWSCIIPV